MSSGVLITLIICITVIIVFAMLCYLATYDSDNKK